jgi:hypothetical protein
MRAICTVIAATILISTAPAAAQRWRDDTAATIGTTAQWTNKVELIDVDGDGWLDAVLANGEGYSSPGDAEASRIFRNRGAWAGEPPFFEEITADVFGDAVAHTRVIKAADVDGDGDPDLFVGNTFGDPSKLYLRDGDGWTDVSATQLPAGEVPWVGDADFGDVDADGDLDLALADWGTDLEAGAPPRLWLNDGAGVFTAAPVGRVPAVNVAWAWELDFADVDGDWDLDLLEASKLGTHSFVFFNDGTGQFTDASAAWLPAHDNNYEMEVMDVDGDGQLDLVTLNDGAGLRDHLFRGTPSGFVDATATALAGANNPGADDNMAAFVDVDSDRDPDLLIGALQGGDRLLINDGTGVFTLAAGEVPGSSPGTLGIAFGDVDHDRRPDLLMGQGEAAFADFLYRATDTVPVDTAAPLIWMQQIGTAAVVIGARVHDGKSPQDPHDLTEVVLEYEGDSDGSAAMTWYGEYLWRGELPASGLYSYRVCATDAAGNRDCSTSKSTAGAGDFSTGNDAVPGDDAGDDTGGDDAPGDGDGGGCCQTGSSPAGGLVLALLVGVAILSRSRR